MAIPNRLGNYIINAIWLFCVHMSKRSTHLYSVNVAADIMSSVLWDLYIVAKQESLANAEVSARQPCWFKVIQGHRFWCQWKAHI